jgi:hypothetical protein
MVPDAEHSLYGQQTDVTLSISTFVHMLLENHPQPKLNWTLIRSNDSEASIVLQTETKPKRFSFVSFIICHLISLLLLHVVDVQNPKNSSINQLINPN